MDEASQQPLHSFILKQQQQQKKIKKQTKKPKQDKTIGLSTASLF